LSIRYEITKVKRLDFGTYFLLILCIGTMQFTTNYALDHMSVAYALSLFQLSAIISVLLGHRFFNEQDIRKKLIGSIIMIIGSVIIILFR
jgi:drug/metabolite transporter (DMT)-like permease